MVPQEIERAKALEKDEAPRNDRAILSSLANFDKLVQSVISISLQTQKPSLRFSELKR
jgi:hypothetical protein